MRDSRPTIHYTLVSAGKKSATGTIVQSIRLQHARIGSYPHEHEPDNRGRSPRKARHSFAGPAQPIRSVRTCRPGGQPAVLERDARDRRTNAGQKAAYAAALNVLALTKKQLGSLNRVNQFVRLSVFVAATAEFTEHPKVADAASELLRAVFGEHMLPSRVVIGVASLPLGSPVELEALLEVK